MPEHTFKLKVYNCQSAQFSVNLTEEYDWYAFREGEKYKAGIILGGRVEDNKYAWNGLPKTGNVWQDNIYKTVFIDGDAFKVCKYYKDKEVELSEQLRCCDTIPATGYCLVPFPIVKRILE